MFIFGGSQVNGYSDGTLIELHLVREGELHLVREGELNLVREGELPLVREGEEVEEIVHLKGFRS